MVQKPFLPLLRELARCYQAFEANSAAHIRGTGLTPSQFDIIVTLGNTPGMTPKELGEKTLITKGTLTGVVDRLKAKKLLRRIPSEHDGRSQIVQLTKKGEAMFEKVFPSLLIHLEQIFGNFSADDYTRIHTALLNLRGAFEPCGNQS